MKRFRRLYSLVVSVAFAAFTIQSIELHVHAAAHEHQHGPAMHHHDAAIRLPIDEMRIAGVDPDDTVVPGQLCAARLTTAQPLAAHAIAICTAPPALPAIMKRTPLIARAHGPPSSRPASLRAPPASLFL